jgi:RNA polymerase sigma-70 factor (ECF subfamily)
VVDGAYNDATTGEAPRTLELSAIYRAEAARVSTWIRRLDPEGDTEDLLHEVFLVVKRRLPEFRSDSALGTWLHAITARVVVAQRRKRRVRRLLLGREGASLAAEHPGTRTPEEALRGRELGARLYVLLERLSERDRTLMILHELDGLTGAELATVAGLAESSVWVALHRARARLRKAYLELYGAPEGA